MRDLSLSLSSAFPKRKSKSFSVNRLNLSLLSGMVMIGMVYLFTVSSMGTKGYEIKKLEENVRQLRDVQKNLQLQVSDLQSITHIQSEVQQLNFVPAASVTYLKDPDFALK
jgi:cell division protein FtsL